MHSPAYLEEWNGARDKALQRAGCCVKPSQQRHFKQNWKVERLFAWLSNFGHLVVCYERYTLNNLGFVHHGYVLILLRESIDTSCVFSRQMPARESKGTTQISIATCTSVFIATPPVKRANEPTPVHRAPAREPRLKVGKAGDEWLQPLPEAPAGASTEP
jgi:hypothetical protein